MSDRYALVPEAVLAARAEGRITFRDVTVFAAIAMHANRSGRAYPGTTAVSELTGIHADNIRKSIASLKTAGLIEHVSGGFKGQNAVYQVATKAGQNDPPAVLKGGSKQPQRRVKKTVKAGQNSPTQQHTTTKEQHLAGDFLSVFSSDPEKTASTAKRYGRSIEFQTWYELFPRHDSPIDAEKAFAKAVKSLAKRFGNRDEAVRYLFAQTQAFAPVGREKGRFCPYPASWLNGGNYDAVQSITVKSSPAAKAPRDIEEVLL
ncbi:helix-turn-helix domain-containing protein [Rosistilla oblonga]|uniref:helix-turn-helix domain-containing protein n=1 Tax=Rosistilla oblonga TaxID=2527990 RepID=UPI003A9697A5